MQPRSVRVTNISFVYFLRILDNLFNYLILLFDLFQLQGHSEFNTCFNQHQFECLRDTG